MSSSVYFLGIGGTLMGNLAVLAKQAGYEVSGYDSKIYPPMSDLLDDAGIRVFEEFRDEHLDPAPDCVVVGNASMPRGTPALERVLNLGLNYQSGAEWLGRNILPGKHVIAVAGTHGKTTTTALVAWILQSAGLSPGYLIGGSAVNFPDSASLGGGRNFVVEADEYDTSYFDRRSKFRHYRPKTLIIGNLEFDHADIFADLDEIKYQFHHLIREIPGNGRIVVPSASNEIEHLLSQGCWTPVTRFDTEATPPVGAMSSAPDYVATKVSPDGRSFEVARGQQSLGVVQWTQLGHHNVANAMSAILAAEHIGIDPAESISYLSNFQGVRRRLEIIAESETTTVYSDFAHHPTAIRAALQAIRSYVGNDYVLAVVEPRTHSMSLGTFQEELVHSCDSADESIWYRNSNIRWNLEALAAKCSIPTTVSSQIDDVVDAICASRADDSHVVIMSNGGFDGIFERVISRMT